MAILSIVLLTLILSMMFFSFAVWWHPFVSAILVVFYGLFLIYDTQLIAGGHKYELSLDDYIIAALMLYTDIILIFLELLKLFGRS